ncbi:MAG: hypothetical protein R2712_04450 [Vicinamibacterales bacterium]
MPPGSFLRRLRRGRPIIVVSGLPRSGTSLAMQMLQAGGVPVASDGARAADDSNPRGYLELESVKGLDRVGDHAWLAACRGRAVKVVSPSDAPARGLRLPGRVHAPRSRRGAGLTERDARIPG